MVTIFHLGYTVNNGSVLVTEHSYYTGLSALYRDNKEKITVSLPTLQRAKFPYSRKDTLSKWTIYKGSALTGPEVDRYNQALDNIEVEDFEL